MLKTISRLCMAAALATTAGMSSAAPAQFQVLNGNDGSQNSSAAPVRLPVLTFVVDNELRLRPVIGIPGAASIANAVDVGFDVAGAEVPAGSDYVLATSTQQAWPMLLQIRGGTITVRSTESLVNRQSGTKFICGQLPDEAMPFHGRRPDCSPEPSLIEDNTKIDGVALSPSGSAAALWSASEGRIYVLTNLSQTPGVAGRFDIGQLGSIATFAISDDGRTLAVAASGENNTALFLQNLNEQAQFLTFVPHVAAIAFVHNGSYAIVADDSENKIYALSGGQLSTIATSENGIAKPKSIAVSNDNQRIFIGNSEPGSITTIGQNGTIAEPLLCNCSLRGLHPTNADSVFRLTDFSGGPVMLFDASAAPARMVFVPIQGSQF